MKFLPFISALVGTVLIIILGELLRGDVAIGLVTIGIILIVSVAIPVAVDLLKKIFKKVHDKDDARGATINIIGFIAEAIVFGAYAGDRLLGGGSTGMVLLATFIAAAIQTVIVVGPATMFYYLNNR